MEAIENVLKEITTNKIDNGDDNDFARLKMLLQSCNVGDKEIDIVQSSDNFETTQTFNILSQS